MITSSDYVKHDTFNDRSAIYRWLNKKSSIIFSNRKDYRTVVNAHCDYKETHQYRYGKQSNKKIYNVIFAHFLEIMIPNNMQDEQKHNFIKKYMMTVNPCYKSDSYLYCYRFTSKGKGTYIEVLCFTRKYFKRKREKKLTYNKDMYWNPKTKRLCKAGHPDAVLIHHKGEVKKDSNGNDMTEIYYVSPTETKIFKYRAIELLHKRLIKCIHYVRLLLNRTYWKQQIRYFSRVTVKNYKSKEKIAVKNQMITRINSLINDIQVALYQTKLWYELEHSFYKLLHQLDQQIYKNYWHDDLSDTTIYLGTKQSLTSIKDNIVLFEDHITDLLEKWWMDKVSDDQTAIFNRPAKVSPVKVLIDTGDYWMDGYRNRWSKSRYTYDQAMEYSKTLHDCHECVDCLDCTGCRDCHNCISCRNCLDCFDCYECISCVTQENIYSCQQFAGLSFTGHAITSKLEWTDNLVDMRLKGVI